MNASAEPSPAVIKQRPSLLRFSAKTIVGLCAVLVMILCWELTSRVAPTYAVPSWGRIIEAFIRLPVQDVIITLARVLISLFAAFLLGLSIAFALFDRPLVEAFVMPFVRLLMAVPVVCWVVFAILWFKNIEFRVFFIMVVVCAPVFIVDSLDAMKSVSRDLREMMASFRAKRPQIYQKLIFPAILPNILTCWKIAMTNGIRIVTIAELVGAASGIGRGLVVAQEMFSVAQVFAWTAVLVLILFSFQLAFGIFERKVLEWRTA